jgi:hypothetical protein
VGTAEASLLRCPPDSLLAKLNGKPKGAAALKECDTRAQLLSLRECDSVVLLLSEAADIEASFERCAPKSPVDALNLKLEGVAVPSGAP